MEQETTITGIVIDVYPEQKAIEIRKESGHSGFYRFDEDYLPSDEQLQGLKGARVKCRLVNNKIRSIEEITRTNQLSEQ